MARTWVAACRGGSFRLRRSGESSGGTAGEHAVTFERKLSRATDTTEKKTNLLEGLLKASPG
ncbi:hypothetical protein K443DRAFT_490145 [Laccaria amethystina LaAM-08-1]|uniref:Uncharacterized protein n=1 Tax=Laccaria amethystina LaAM-08-1 TaxID=1095629 RepID=A0A0C9WMR7_9AGAR|nr:hypothetical protein K443DRAFT_490145 [Laccaria amethystina LaAM-08-1]